jgi:hypothetical protein
VQCLRNMAMDTGLAREIEATLHTAAAQLPLNAERQASFNARLAHLPALASGSAAEQALGAALGAAFQRAPSAAQTDWAYAESQAAKHGLFERHIPLPAVIEAICTHSPGAVSPDRQTVVAKYLETRLDALREDWLEDLSRRDRGE